jgi:hypothetical protein
MGQLIAFRDFQANFNQYENLIRALRATPTDCPPVLPEPRSSVDELNFVFLIVADFPALLAQFQGKRPPLLWPDRRDGFGVSAFHSRCHCHGHAPLWH